jgi:hypothetical protein
MTTPRIYWAQAQQDPAPAQPRIYWAQAQQDQLGGAQPRVYWTQIIGPPVIPLPSAPELVALTARTGVTAVFTVTPGAVPGDSYALQVESPSGAGNWATPAGSWNGLVFSASGLSPAASYRARAAAINLTGQGPWALGDAFATDNTGQGGAQIGGDSAAVSVAIVGGISGAVSALATVMPTAGVQFAARGGIAGAVSATATAARVAVAFAGSGGISGAVTAQVSIVSAPAPGVASPTAALIRWRQKDPRETDTIEFTFPGNVTEVLLDVDAYSPYGVADPQPNGIFDGSFTVSGAVIRQKVRAGVNLVDYYIDAVATVDGQRLVQAMVLPVREK